MSSNTENATIRYTLDGNEPSVSSAVYSEPIEVAPGVTVKAKAFEDIYHIPSDTESLLLPESLTPETIALGTELNDGYIFYDRGEEYGDYTIIGGNLIKISGTDWRYMIIEKRDFGKYPFGYPVTLGTQLGIGSGLFNTELIINQNSSTPGYCTDYIVEYREASGKQWFMPSLAEAQQISKDKVSTIESKYYLTSSESSSNVAYEYNPITNSHSGISKSVDCAIRLVRRI